MNSLTRIRVVDYEKGNEMNLKRRIDRIEAELKPRQLRAVIQGFLAKSSPTLAPASLSADDPRLQQGVDDNGGAIVFRWWSVWFFEGTREQQEARLEELRLDPQLQKPWSEGDMPVRFEGGAGCEDAYRRIEEERRNHEKYFTRRVQR